MPHKEIPPLSQEPEKVPTTTHIFIRPNNSNNSDLARSLYEASGITPQEQSLHEVVSGIKDGSLAFDNTTEISIVYPQDERRAVQILTSLLVHPILRTGNNHDRCNFPKINILFDKEPSKQIINDLELAFDSAISVVDLEFNTIIIEGNKQVINSESLIEQETRKRIFGSISFQTI